MLSVMFMKQTPNLFKQNTFMNDNLTYPIHG